MTTSFTIYQCDLIGHFLSYDVPPHVTKKLGYFYAHGGNITGIFHDRITGNFYKIKGE